MIRTVRIFIVIATASLIVASLIHLGVLMEGYRHREAGISEGVFAVVMLVGLAFTWLPGRGGLRAGMASLVLGLVGTLVGLFTIIIGVGPQTVPEIVYHLALTTLLITGVVIGWRGLSEHAGESVDSEGARLKGSR